MQNKMMFARIKYQALAVAVDRGDAGDRAIAPRAGAHPPRLLSRPT
jgi:hypothetical protein